MLDLWCKIVHECPVMLAIVSRQARILASGTCLSRTVSALRCLLSCFECTSLWLWTGVGVSVNCGQAASSRPKQGRGSHATVTLLCQSVLAALDLACNYNFGVCLAGSFGLFCSGEAVGQQRAAALPSVPAHDSPPFLAETPTQVRDISGAQTVPCTEL